MLETAVWPVSLKEHEGRIDGVINLLTHFAPEQVNLLHVSEGNRQAQNQRQAGLEKLQDRLSSMKFQWEISFSSGNVPKAICDFARDRDADFVILPWRAKIIIARALFGDVVRDVIRLSNRLVVVYKNHPDPQKEENVQRIMYATEFAATNSVIVPYVKHLGLKAEILYLLTVGARAPDPEAEKRRRKEMASKLDALAEECSEYYNQVEEISDLGNTHKRITQQAHKKAVDLIIIGKHDKPGHSRLVLGSTVERLLQQAPCSVLIVPPESHPQSWVDQDG
ncbi:MAG: universal stress protein [Bacteroidales bacterium]|nr:universal stress protein [Bacteroidales bacterium]